MEINKLNEISKPVLLAPVSNFVMLSTAVYGGCDAVYFGIRGLNMRSGAKNFTIDDIKKVVEQCHDNGIKSFLTVNTIIYDEELNRVKQILKIAKEAGIDSIICWDHSVISLAKKLGLETNLSTQASVSNYEALKFYYDSGVRTFTLARELNLEQIKELKKKISKNKLDAKIECFIHGAMCIAISGRCFLSQFLFNKSANRGECIQPCRRSYIIYDSEGKYELNVRNNYILSPKDLCTMQFIDKLIEAGIDVFKIEGRGRSPEYVKVVVESYREAIDAYYKGELTKELKDKLTQKMKAVYNRGFSTGFYLGKPIWQLSDSYGNKATKTKHFIGKVINFYKRPSVAEIIIQTGELNANDELLVIGNKTGTVFQKIESIEKDNKKIKTAKKGQSVAIKFDTIVRKNDEVYLRKDN